MFGTGLCHGSLMGGVNRGRLIDGAQCLEELNECGCLGRAEVLAICGHVAAALKNLADQLIFSEACCDEIQSGTALSANACN